MTPTDTARLAAARKVVHPKLVDDAPPGARKQAIPLFGRGKKKAAKKAKRHGIGDALGQVLGRGR